MTTVLREASSEAPPTIGLDDNNRGSNEADKKSTGTAALNELNPHDQSKADASCNTSDPTSKIKSGKVSESLAYTNVCENCGKSGASRRCSGCKDAPLTDGSLHVGPSYCDKECQSSHWTNHKTECKIHQASRQVQAILRAGNLLSKLFFLWREACYDRPTVKVEVKQNSIYIYEDWYTSETFCRGGRHRPLKDSLFTSSNIKKGALANMGCDVSLAFMHENIRTFLEDITTTVQEVEVKIKNVVRPIYIIDATSGPCQLHGHHHVLKVQLKSGSTWAIDMTAAQFGWDEVVVPWSEYYNKNCQNVVMIEGFGSRSAFFQQIIDNPGLADDDVHTFAVWTRSMGDIFGKIVDEIMKDNGMEMKGFFSNSDSRWTKKESLLLRLVQQEMVSKAQEADRVWAGQSFGSKEIHGR